MKYLKEADSATIKTIDAEVKKQVVLEMDERSNH